MAKVIINNPKQFNTAMKKFKKQVQEDKILLMVKDREHYIKPSDQRKRKKAAAISRRKNAEKKKLQDMLNRY